jgi:hypothetical protein
VAGAGVELSWEREVAGGRRKGEEITAAVEIK